MLRAPGSPEATVLPQDTAVLGMSLSSAQAPQQTNVDFFDTCALLFGEGNGNPLQCSCQENPRDGGAWSAAIYGVT